MTALPRFRPLWPRRDSKDGETAVEVTSRISGRMDDLVKVTASAEHVILHMGREGEAFSQHFFPKEAARYLAEQLEAAASAVEVMQRMRQKTS